MIAAFHPPKPIPADPLGQRLTDIFGRQLWDFIEAPAPEPGEKPEWLTVTDYQLRPRILWQRWQDWCRSVQNYYWPYGDEPKRGSDKEGDRLNQNQQRAIDAQQRIQQAYEQLQVIGLPETIRGLMERLAQLAGCPCGCAILGWLALAGGVIRISSAEFAAITPPMQQNFQTCKKAGQFRLPVKMSLVSLQRQSGLIRISTRLGA